MSGTQTQQFKQLGLVSTTGTIAAPYSNGDGAPILVDEHGRPWVRDTGGGGGTVIAQGGLVNALGTPGPYAPAATVQQTVDARGRTFVASAVTGAVGDFVTHYHNNSLFPALNLQQIFTGAVRLLRVRGIVNAAATRYLQLFDTVSSTAGVPRVQLSTASVLSGSFDLDLTQLGGVAFTTGVYAALSSTSAAYTAPAANELWIEAFTRPA